MIQNSKFPGRYTARAGKTKNSSEYGLAIGVSGSGTTFEAIAREVKSGNLNMNLAFLFADRDCLAIKKAKKLGIRVVCREKSEDINKFHQRIIRNLINNKIEFVVLAGYLRLFPITDTDSFLVLNSHPAAIPYFGGDGMWGIKVHEAVISWAKKTNYRYPYTFSTVHIATAKYDRGPAVGIKSLKISTSDTAESLAKRLLPIEHKNYIEVLEKLSENIIDYPEYPKEFLPLIGKK